MKCMFCGKDDDLIAIFGENRYKCESCDRYFEAKELYEDEV